MITWLEVIKFSVRGNPEPDKKVSRSEEEWKSFLTPEQYAITRLKGTEKPNSSEMCKLFEPGLYACICCGTVLFDSGQKFQSSTGWPSFTQPYKDNAVAYRKDTSHGMYRVEALCNTCDAHLGHVFQDGPPPGGLRYCINAVAMQKIETNERKAVFGGGCFWCTEAIFQQVDGVIKVVSGYSGGRNVNPTYKEVSSGLSGHAEVVEVTYDSESTSFEELLRIHLSTHNPAKLQKEGKDSGSQYRSIVFYRTEEEKSAAIEVIKEHQADHKKMILTELKHFEAFYPAEEHHQDYYRKNPDKPFCTSIIEPKLSSMKK